MKHKIETLTNILKEIEDITTSKRKLRIKNNRVCKYTELEYGELFTISHHLRGAIRSMKILDK